MCLVPAYEQESLNEVTPELLACTSIKVHLVSKVVYMQRIMYIKIYEYGIVMRGEGEEFFLASCHSVHRNASRIKEASKVSRQENLEWCSLGQTHSRSEFVEIYNIQT